MFRPPSKSPGMIRISLKPKSPMVLARAIDSSGCHAVTRSEKRQQVEARLRCYQSNPISISLLSHHRTMSTSASSSSYTKALQESTLNPHVRNVEYAVRGELANRSVKYARLIAEGKGKEENLPFDSVVTANIGNPQQQPNLAQPPLTFWRQVAALTEYPALMDSPEGRALFPKDAQERAKEILKDVGSVGAYSHSKGALSVRKHVAEFIEGRDGHPADPELIYLTSGASGGVSLLLSMVIASPEDGVMIPIPQYPLYTAALALYGARPVRYDLDSSADWSLDVSQMREKLQDAKKEGTNVRALVVINPGNPTGSCLPLEAIQDVLRLAHDEHLLVMADEVYQTNIFQPEDRPFHSFKKVLRDFSSSKDEAERRIAEDVELVSFHSISKGVSGECGRRGGYFELVNIDPDVEAEVYKLASVSLCPPLSGQIGIDLLVRPPREGEESYESHSRETQKIHKTLLERSQRMREAFEKLPRMTCSEAQGALYLFPELDLPPKVLEQAKKDKLQPDALYCSKLLDSTGICVVPGSGFGKMPTPEGKAWFRTTILAKETDAFLERFGTFHKEFMKEYGAE